MKSLFETLAVLSTGAALLSGCGGAAAPVNAAEVPAATEAKPSVPVAPATENMTGVAAAGVVATATPAVAAVPATPPVDKSAGVPAAGAKPGAPATPGAKPLKKSAAKKADASGSCGAGTCG